MWKREEPSKAEPVASEPLTRSGLSAGRTATKAADYGTSGSLGRDVVNIGKSVVMKGELSGSEDLAIEGRVEGKIELRQHVLTIGPNGKISAEIYAKSVVVMGEVSGNITAAEKIMIRENGSVDGDVSAPRVAISEGAHFRGSIDMQRAESAKTTTDAKSGAKPVVAPSPAVRAAN